MVFLSGDDIARDLADRGVDHADDDEFATILASSIRTLAESERRFQEIDLADRVDEAILGLSERLDDSNAAYERDRAEAVAPEVDRYLRLRSGG